MAKSEYGGKHGMHPEHASMKGHQHQHHGEIKTHRMNYAGERPIHGEENPSHDKGEKKLHVGHHSQPSGHQASYKHHMPKREDVTGMGQE